MIHFEMPGFFKKSFSGNPYLLVEIGNDWIKLAEVGNPSTGVKKVHSVRLADLHSEIPSALTEIFKEHHFSTQKVVLCVPRHLVTVRILDFPAVDGREIRDMINLQIGKQTPYLKEEILWAYRVLPGEGEGVSKIALVIVRRTIVQERLGILEAAGTRVQTIFLSTEGLFHWFDRIPVDFSKDQSYGMIDIDSNYSDFLVIKKGGWFFSRSILLGSNFLFENKNPENHQKFIQEIVHSRELYAGEAGQAKISSILVAGATENAHELVMQLQKTLDCSVEIIAPQGMKDLFPKSGRSALNPAVLSWTAFSGFLRASPKDFLDLAPSEMKFERAVRKLRSQIFHVAIMAAGLIMIFALMALINFQYKRDYLKKLNAEVLKIENAASDLERKREWIKMIEERLSAKRTAVAMLSPFLHKIPSEVHLTSLAFDDNDKMTFKGVGRSMSDVLNFNALLAKAGIFERVPPPVYASKRIENNKEIIEFEMIGYFKK
jgi:Tfp pilus assembly PilM family ATPase